MNVLETAEATLLAPYGLDTNGLDRVFAELSSKETDLSDLYFQSSRSEGWMMEDSIIKSGSWNIDQGVGVRAVSGEKSGFAYSDEISMDALLASARSASAISKAGKNGGVKAWTRQQDIKALYAQDNPLDSLTEVEKIELLKQADSIARSSEPCVEQVMANVAAVHDVVLIADQDGNLSADIRPMVRLNVTVIVEKNGKRESGSCGGGGRFGLNYFTESERVREYTLEAIRLAMVNLDAVDAPTGEQQVVLGSGWPGILLHEAVGHGLEGDFNRKGTSAFSDRIGEQVASKGVTVVDDGTIENRRGSLSVDDEGTPTKCTTLIEDGVLRGYMQDKMNAKLMGHEPTGNGRRQAYNCLPMPRMTNTYMLAGEHNPQEILESVQNGLYAVSFSGGQVDITSGKFVFSASEAYLIEDGKITKPVKGATLIGNGPEVMTRISMVGDDLELDRGVGVCGKNGQGVPVGVGQPTLRIDGLTVGGTAG